MTVESIHSARCGEILRAESSRSVEALRALWREDVTRELLPNASINFNFFLLSTKKTLQNYFPLHRRTNNSGLIDCNWQMGRKNVDKCAACENVFCFGEWNIFAFAARRNSDVMQIIRESARRRSSPGESLRFLSRRRLFCFVLVKLISSWVIFWLSPPVN